MHGWVPAIMGEPELVCPARPLHLPCHSGSAAPFRGLSLQIWLGWEIYQNRLKGLFQRSGSTHHSRVASDGHCHGREGGLVCRGPLVPLWWVRLRLQGSLGATVVGQVGGG